MARRACVVCGNVKELTRQQLGMLHRRFPFICKPKCLLEYINRINDFWECCEFPEWLATAERPASRAVTEGGSYCPYQKITFRSKYEKEISYWFMAKGIPFEYEPFIIKIGNMIYAPDFYLPENNHILVEAKGAWLGRSKKKMATYVECYPNSPLVIIPWMFHKPIISEGWRKAQELENACQG